jgi:hypothetical protein
MLNSKPAETMRHLKKVIEFSSRPGYLVCEFVRLDGLFSISIRVILFNQVVNSANY